MSHISRHRLTLFQIVEGYHLLQSGNKKTLTKKRTDKHRDVSVEVVEWMCQVTNLLP